MPKSSRWIALIAAGGLALAGCGGTPVTDTGSAGAGGLKAGPGFDGTTITVGVLNPTTGPVAAAAGLPVLNALELRVKRVNDAGGIAGKYPIKLDVQDTQYSPQTALQVYTAMSGNVVAVGSVLGTGVVQALLPKFAQDNIVAIPATAASEWVPEAHLLPTQPTYEASFINGLSYLVGQPGGADKKFCLYRQDDATGEANKKGVDFGAEKLGLTLAADVVFPPSTTDFTAQVQQLKAANCDVVLFAASATFAQKTIASAIQLDFAPTWLSNVSGVPLFLMGSPSQDYLAGHWLAAMPGVQWGDDTVPGMAQLVEDYQKYGDPKATIDPPLWLSGYTMGLALESLLTKAVGDGDLTPQHLLDISHSSDFVIDFKGLSPSFTYGPAADRKSPTAVSIFSIDPTVTGNLKLVKANVDSDAAKAF